MTQEEKQQAHDILCRRYDETAQKAVAAIEPRLKEYFDGLRDEPTMHNAYEILCGVKFLRLLRTYEFNERKVRQVVRLRRPPARPTRRTPTPTNSEICLRTPIM